MRHERISFSPDVPSKATQKKALTYRTEEGFPVQSFQSLLEDLGTLTKKRHADRKETEHRVFDAVPANASAGESIFPFGGWSESQSVVRTFRSKNGRTPDLPLFFDFFSKNFSLKWRMFS